MVNLPLGEKMALRVSGFDEDVPGYIYDPLRSERDVNDGHQGGRAASLLAGSDRYSVHPADRRLAAIQIQRHNTRSMSTRSRLQPLYGDLSQERALQEPSSFKYENYNATIDWNAGPFSVLSTTSYGILNSDTDARCHAAYTADWPVRFSDSAPADALLDDNVGLKKFTQEIRLTSSPTRPAGVAGRRLFHPRNRRLERASERGHDSRRHLLACLSNPSSTPTYKETAGFANLTYHFNSQFDIQAGGRYSHNEQNATEIINFNPLTRIYRRQVYHRELERQCIHLFGGAELACGCEHHGVCAPGDRLSSRRPECAAARSRRRACRANTARTRPPMSSSGSDRLSSTACFPSTWHLPCQLEEHSAVGSRRRLRHQRQRRHGASQGLEWTFDYVAGARPQVRMGRRLYRGEAHLARTRLEREFRRPAALRARSGARRSTVNMSGRCSPTIRALSARPGAMSAREAAISQSPTRPTPPASWSCRATTPPLFASASTTLTTRLMVYGKNLERCARHHQLRRAPAAPYSTRDSVIQPRTDRRHAVRQILRPRMARTELRWQRYVAGHGSASPYLLFLGDTTERGYAKTAFGLRDWARERCVGEWSCAGRRSRPSLPRLTPRGGARARRAGAGDRRRQFGRRDRRELDSLADRSARVGTRHDQRHACQARRHPAAEERPRSATAAA